MPRRMLIAAGGGLLAAGFYLPGLAGLPGAVILAYLSALPIFTVGLATGLAPTIMAGAVGTIAAGIGSGWMGGVMFSCLFVAPALVIVWQAMEDGVPVRGVRFARTGATILWLTALGFAVLLAAWLACLHSPGGLQAVSRRLLSTLVAAMPLEQEGLDAAASARIVAMFSAVLPGVLVLSWLFMVVVNGVLAQGLLVRLRRNLRPSPALSALVLPSWVVMALAAIVAAAVLGRDSLGFLGVNGLIIMILPFFFAGLAVLHAATQRMRLKVLVRVAVYAVMVLSGWPVLIFTVLGVADQWLGMRQKLAAAR